MAITWTSGTLQSVPIQWLSIETTAPVNTGKELLSIEFIFYLLNSHGEYAYFDNFSLKRNLTNDKTLGNYISYLPLPAGTTEYPVFGAIVDCHIAAAHLVPQQNIIGDDADPVQLILRNADSGEIICTKTFITGVNANAYELTSFGGVDEDARELYVGNGVRFETFGPAIPDIMLVLEWNLS